MATLTVLPARVYKGSFAFGGLGGDEAASQTFKIGNLIAPNTDGKYAAVAAGAAATTAKVALATTAGQNVASPTARVGVQRLTDEHVLDITAGGTASTAELLEVGKQYGYAIDGTTGQGYLNLSDTTNVVFEILSSTPTRGVVGDTNVNVQAKLITTAKL